MFVCSGALRVVSERISLVEPLGEAKSDYVDAEERGEANMYCKVAGACDWRMGAERRRRWKGVFRLI